MATSTKPPVPVPADRTAASTVLIPEASPPGGQVTATAGTHVLIIVQNLPVPLDRRVWLECQALVANGYEVSVICPKGPGDPSRQLIDGCLLYTSDAADD